MEFELSTNLSDLLPPLYREIEEYQQICRVEETRFEQLASSALTVYRNFFVQTADSDSVRRWENVLRIQASPFSETMAFRKQRILSRLRTRPPYTLAFLYQQLDALIGPGRWDCQVEYPDYLLRIRSDAENPASRTELPHLVNRIKPAHIAFRLCLFYDPVPVTAYAAVVPCGMAAFCTVRLPGGIEPRSVAAHGYAAGSMSASRMQTTVELPGAIRPKNITAQAYATGRLAHAHETVTIKIGGQTT